MYSGFHPVFPWLATRYIFATMIVQFGAGAQGVVAGVKELMLTLPYRNSCQAVDLCLYFPVNLMLLLH